MKKVLMVSCEGLGNGGVQNVMMNIVRNLQHEYQFDMLLFTLERRFYDDEFENYGKIFRMKNRKFENKILNKADFYLSSFKVCKFVQKILKENGPYDIIHCNNEYQSAPCLKAAYKMNVPIRISHFHTLDYTNSFLKLYNTIWKRINKSLILHYATDIIACSKKCADSYFKPSQCIIIANAIDLHKFDLKKYKNKKNPYSFVHIGRFCECKNQKFIVDIFAHIKEKFPDATLKLVGGFVDNYINSVKETAVKYNVLNSMEFLPHDTDIPKLLAESEYMIFPSKSEGFGIVVLEAQAMGVRCFISDAVSMEVDAGLCTQIPLKYNSSEWANIIIDSILQQNAHKHTKNINEFGMSKYISKIKKIYENGEK